MKVSRIVFGALAALAIAAPALAANELYSFDVPKRYPKAAKLWEQSVPSTLRDDPWITYFEGVSTPVRNVTISGRRYILAELCQPHDCGDHQAHILITPDQSRVLGYVEWVEWGDGLRTPTMIFIGDFVGQELYCLKGFADENELTAC